MHLPLSICVCKTVPRTPVKGAGGGSLRDHSGYMNALRREDNVGS
jgi:hypothetical protein